MLQQHQEKLLVLEGASGSAAQEQRAELSALLARARVLEREVAEFKTAQEKELKRRFLEEKEKVLESIRRAAREFNASGAYNLLIDGSATSSNGLPMVLDVQGLEDVTDAIIARLKE